MQVYNLHSTHTYAADMYGSHIYIYIYKGMRDIEILVWIPWYLVKNTRWKTVSNTVLRMSPCGFRSYETQTVSLQPTAPVTKVYMAFDVNEFNCELDTRDYSLYSSYIPTFLTSTYKCWHLGTSDQFLSINDRLHSKDRLLSGVVESNQWKWTLSVMWDCSSKQAVKSYCSKQMKREFAHRTAYICFIILLTIYANGLWFKRTLSHEFTMVLLFNSTDHVVVGVLY